MLLVAYEEGASFVTLEVRDSNTAARQFYRKWGFVQMQRLKGHYDDTGEDGLILAFTDLAASVVRAPTGDGDAKACYLAPEEQGLRSRGDSNRTLKERWLIHRRQ